MAVTLSRLEEWPLTPSTVIQVEMTPPGTMVEPAASPKEKKLLEAKYKIFRETIEIQKRWRKEIEEASK